MNHNPTSAELKRMAKGQLLGKYSMVISAFLAYFSIVLGVMLVYSLVSSGQVTTFGMVLDFAVTFLMNLFIGIFAVGISALFLNIACERPFSAMDVFFGFRHQPDKAIIIRFILAVIGYCAMAPSLLLSLYYRANPSGGVFLASCIALIFGYAVTVYVDLLYSQWTYIILDFPDLSVKETMRLSRSYMKGHKARRFYIGLSFVPLFLLCLLSCGIGLLWVLPYMSGVYANFYLDLARGHNNDCDGKTDSSRPTEPFVEHTVDYTVG